MNHKQKTLGQENETNKRDDNEAETQASKQLDGTQNDSSFKSVSDEQESECRQSDDKTNEEDAQFVRELAPAWNWYCPTTPAWRKQKCKQFLYQLPILTLNVARKEH